MENRLDADMDDELGYSRYDYKNKGTDNRHNGTVARHFVPALAM